MHYALEKLIILSQLEIMHKKAELRDRKIQISIVMSRTQKSEYAKLAVEMDMSLSQLIRIALRELKTKKDRAATRS